MSRADASSSPAATVGTGSYVGGTAQKQIPALKCSAEQVLLMSLNSQAIQALRRVVFCRKRETTREQICNLSDTHEHKEEKWNSKACGSVPGRQRHHPQRERGDFSAMCGEV